MVNWIVDFVRSIFNKFIFDIYIYIDYMKGVNFGKFLGFGLLLVVEIISGIFFSVELVFNF